MASWITGCMQECHQIANASSTLAPPRPLNQYNPGDLVDETIRLQFPQQTRSVKANGHALARIELNYTTTVAAIKQPANTWLAGVTTGANTQSVFNCQTLDLLRQYALGAKGAWRSPTRGRRESGSRCRSSRSRSRYRVSPISSLIR